MLSSGIMLNLNAISRTEGTGGPALSSPPLSATVPLPHPLHFFPLYQWHMTSPHNSLLDLHCLKQGHFSEINVK